MAVAKVEQELEEIVAAGGWVVAGGRSKVGMVEEGGG